MTAASLRQTFLHGRDFILARKLPILFGSLYAVLSVFVLCSFLSISLLGDNFRRARFDDMMDGTAWKPFVYRILIPKTTQAVVAATPPSWQDSIATAVEEWKSGSTFTKKTALFPWVLKIFPSADSTYPRLVAIMLIYGCLWGYIMALARLAAAVFPGQPALRFFAPVFGLLVIPSFSWKWIYIYDIPLLFLSTACFYCMATQKWKAYIPIFLLACLNKETAFFILIFFALWGFHHIPRRTYLWLLALQAAIFLAVKVAVTLAYTDNIGWVAEQNLYKVLTRDLFSRSQYQRILMIALMFFLLTFGWQKKPLFLKYVFWVLPCVYTAYLFFGIPGEYRVFFDIMPLLVLLSTHTLIEGTGVSQAAWFRESHTQKESGT